MSPHKDGKSGTYILDRQFGEVGRIKLASGTTHLPTFRRLDDMLTGLKNVGRFDVLRGIKARWYTPLQVLEHYEVGRLDKLPRGGAMRPLKEALESWWTALPQETEHTKNQKYNVKHLVKGAGARASVADLPAAVRRLRTTLAKTPRQFNSVRSTALAFARDTEGKSSDVYAGVRDVTIYGKKAIAAASTRAPRPVMPPALLAIGARMTPDERAQLWTLALTGMRPKEYFGAWEDRGAAILVRGTKTEAAVRTVPALRREGAPARAAWQEKKFRERLAEVSEGQVRLYDLRRTFARWLEEAGIVRARRKLYLGHSTGDVTSLYERHEVQAFLAEDTAKLAAWLDQQLTPKAEQTPNLKAI